jgi:hypothetical protein
VGGIFISYRREDSAPWAGRLYERLAHEFPRQQLMMDVDTIEPGLDFVKVLDTHISTCDVLLAIIGPGWTEAKNSRGVRRLDDPNDFVRIELGSALKRDIRVIPILVDGASMPQSGDLPEPLKALASRNAVQVSHVRFGSDTQGLVEVLQRVVRPVTPKRPACHRWICVYRMPSRNRAQAQSCQRPSLVVDGGTHGRGAHRAARAGYSHCAAPAMVRDDSEEPARTRGASATTRPEFHPETICRYATQLSTAIPRTQNNRRVDRYIGVKPKLPGG